MIIIREGKVGFGVELAQVPCKVVNRVGTALVVGDVLMLDMNNSTFDAGASETGVYGNGLTPAANGTAGDGGAAATQGFRIWPKVLITDGAGSASGAIVGAIAYGRGTGRLTGTGAILNRGSNCHVTTPLGRTPQIEAQTAAPTIGLAYVGQTLAPHTAAAGAELISMMFCGLVTPM